jgi:nitronate monooxygenase
LTVSAMWADRRLIDLFRVELPIVAAPMANFAGLDLAIAVAEAGGLGSLPCAALDPDRIRADAATFRSRARKPLHLNFFCHAEAPPDHAKDRAWLKRLAPYYTEFDAEPPPPPLKAAHPPFGETDCAAVEAIRPEIVSFHFGLPAPSLLQRVKAAGCKIMSSATTLREAHALAENGVDAIIAQGAEAGGHRGMFLETDVATQVGIFALVRSIAAAVKVPVIAAGGIADGKGIAAALALGASAAQIGTAYLLCPEATISALHRAALSDPGRETAITNVLTGRPARGVVNRFMREQGPLNDAAPNFPLARSAIAPLRAKAEAMGRVDFSPLWSGQAANLPRPKGARELTLALAEGARSAAGARLALLGRNSIDVPTVPARAKLDTASLAETERPAGGRRHRHARTACRPVYGGKARRDDDGSIARRPLRTLGRAAPLTVTSTWPRISARTTLFLGVQKGG